MNGPILRHVGIPVSNLDRAVEFYRQMGFQVVRFSRERWQKDLQIMKLSVPGELAQLELIEGIWNPHFAVTVPEIDPFLRYVEFSKDDSYYILDPDGNWVELVEVKR